MKPEALFTGLAGGLIVYGTIIVSLFPVTWKLMIFRHIYTVSITVSKRTKLGFNNVAILVINKAKF